MHSPQNCHKNKMFTRRTIYHTRAVPLSCGTLSLSRTVPTTRIVPSWPWYGDCEPSRIPDKYPYLEMDENQRIVLSGVDTGRYGRLGVKSIGGVM